MERRTGLLLPLIFAAFFAAADRGRAQGGPVITSFSQNGSLECAELQPGTIATVEWASTPAGPWKTTWEGLDQVVADADGKIRVEVPMFYRVRGTPREPVGIETNLADLTVGEGETAPLQVRLTAQPPADVTVTATSATPGKASAGPASLTFTPANWSTYQMLTIGGATDADAKEERVNLTLSAPAMIDKVVAILVVDDEQSLVVSANSMVINEGASLLLSVRLFGEPAGSVTVVIYSMNPAVATAFPAQLTFTPENWSTPQLVSITGVQNTNPITGQTTLSLGSALTQMRTVTVTVINDD